MKLAIRRWWTIMPIVFITYSLAYLDRANFGFAVGGRDQPDLGISKGLSSLIGALFFLGYFFFQIPGAIYARTPQRQETRVREPDPVGRLRGADRHGAQRPR